VRAGCASSSFARRDASSRLEKIITNSFVTDKIINTRLKVQEQQLLPSSGALFSPSTSHMFEKVIGCFNCTVNKVSTFQIEMLTLFKERYLDELLIH
jgi:hypothetical protein